jgi:hypothetical protein
MTDYVWLGSSVVPLGIGSVVANVFNVRSYGAKGDGSTDDTTPVLQAAAAFQAAVLAGIGQAALYFPNGQYLVKAEIVITGLSGGTIAGDGPLVSVIITKSIGARGGVVLVNCDHVKVRDLGQTGANFFAAITSNVTGGSSNSLTVASFNQGIAPSPGMKCSISNHAGTGELLTVRSVTGAGPYTVTFFTTCKNSYTSGAAYICYASLMSFCNYSDQTIVSGPGSGGKVSSFNTFENCVSGNSSALETIAGFGATCRGGGPVQLKTACTAGVTQTVTVSDVGEKFIGEVLTFNDDFLANNVEQVTIQSINPATNQLTFTAPVTHNHVTTNNLCYLATSSDVNNEQHTYINCRSVNAELCGWYADGQNQLANTLVRGSIEGVSISCFWGYRGGSFNVLGTTFATAGGFLAIPNGPQQHVWQFTNCVDESLCGLWQSDAAGGCQNLNITWTQLDKKGGPANARSIDSTSFRHAIRITNCTLDDPPTGSWYVFDLLAGGFYGSAAPASMTVIGNRIGVGAVIYNGLYVVSLGNTYSNGNPEAATVSNGSLTQAFDVGANGGQLPGQLVALYRLTMTPVAAPTVNNSFYVDTADNKLKWRGNAGTVTILALP